MPEGGWGTEGGRRTDHVGLKMRPPESNSEERSRRVGAFVCDVVVGLSKDVEAVFGPDDQLVVAAGAASPETVIANVEASREAMEGGERVVGEVRGAVEGTEVAPDVLEAVVFQLSG